MTAILRQLNPLEWAGPIFTKELRVTSRRKRFYVLRVLYLLAMIAFVALTWVRAYDHFAITGSSTAQVMSAVGETVVKSIVWFEFIACQVLAVVLNCNTISGEVTAGTLGVLMTTPIRPFQIVMGKLLSRLLQVFLLLAITLPLLAVVRAFGGVQWSAVVYSLVVTAAASFLVGSIAMFFSCRRFGPITVIFLSLLVYGMFVLLPSIGLGPYWMLNPVQSMQHIWAGSLAGSLQYMSQGRVLGKGLWTGMGAVGSAIRADYPALNMTAMLGLSLLLLWRASCSVGKLAKWAANQSPTSRTSALGARPGKFSKATRRVSGSAVLWKEMRFYLPDSRGKTILAVVVLLAVLVGSYICAVAGTLHYETMLHFLYLMLYLLGIWLCCLALACTAITVERESRALPILLTAPISDGQIIWAKTASVLRRVSPLAGLMLAHLVVFSILPTIHPLGLLYMSLIALYSSSFIICLGMYCSTRTSTGTNSIVLALVLILCLWLAAPMVLNVGLDMGWFNIMSRRHPGLHYHHEVHPDVFNFLNPLVQMGVMVVSTTGQEKARLHPYLLEYRWVGAPAGTGAASVVVGSLLVHAALSAGLLWRAKVRLRKNVFSG